MKILITGASGFIGSFLVEAALNRGMEVWAGIRATSSRQYLQDPRIRFIDLPFNNRTKLRETLQTFSEENGKLDYIIHNAGLTKSLHSYDFFTVNYIYTLNLVEILQETGLVPKKFLLMSSLSAQPEPDTEYGKSKLRAERMLETQTGFPYIIFRPTGVYGPRDRDYFLMIKTINSGLDVAAGLKPQRLTFIFVKDLAKAAMLAIESKVFGKTYNIADGDVYSDSEYTEIVRQSLGKARVTRIRVPLFILKTVCVFSEIFGKITGKPATLNLDKYKILKKRDWTCDTRPLFADLNFNPDYPLESGIAESIKWYRDMEWI
jgi:nucleoside-diphosphate-sugar epimerase